MRSAIILILSILVISLSACEKDKSKLIHAKPYQIVGEYDKILDTDDRNAKMYFITSSANTFDEFAQTAIQAAFDIHKKYKKLDLIQVILVPDKEMVATSISYASASYALDKKGAKGLSGADQNTMINYKWLVRAANKPLSEQEFEIAKLWFKHRADFPSEDLISSLGYNKEKLVKFIANTLKLEVDEIIRPHVILKDYTDLDFLD